MNIERQIEKTKQVVSQISTENKLILENQLVILETLKQIKDNVTKRDRSQFGPG